MSKFWCFNTLPSPLQRHRLPYATAVQLISSTSLKNRVVIVYRSNVLFALYQFITHHRHIKQVYTGDNSYYLIYRWLASNNIVYCNYTNSANRLYVVPRANAAIQNTYRKWPLRENGRSGSKKSPHKLTQLHSCGLWGDLQQAAIVCWYSFAGKQFIDKWHGNRTLFRPLTKLKWAYRSFPAKWQLPGEAIHFRLIRLLFFQYHSAQYYDHGPQARCRLRAVRAHVLHAVNT